ncbi:DUF485 domain-containing protein [Streptomyces sp. NPDC057682]|uniref:DUF485 domain-containing protein n=1 Tax=unclassified Streptomyces TaxID=2593676 RepID=UPI003654D122
MSYDPPHPARRTHPRPSALGTAPPAAPSVPALAPAPGNHGDLRRLRAAYRLLRRTATFTALGYFTLFLVLSGFAPSFMGRPVGGGLTVGLALGLCQLPVTLLAIALYERIARRTVDPRAAGLRRTAARR